jgi:serpin B
MRCNRSLLAAVAALALLVPLVSGYASAQGATPARAAHDTRAAGDPAGRATTELGLDLLPRLERGKNVVFSPDSIAAALAMAGTGARGRTAAQIAHVLHLSSPASFDALGELQQAIVSEQGADPALNSEAPTLSVANGLFLQSGYPLEPAFTGAFATGFRGAATAGRLHDAERRRSDQ